MAEGRLEPNVKEQCGKLNNALQRYPCSEAWHCEYVGYMAEAQVAEGIKVANELT